MASARRRFASTGPGSDALSDSTTLRAICSLSIFVAAGTPSSAGGNPCVIERASVNSQGIQANDNSTEPRLSYDGRYVAFSSVASNLVLSDTNGSFDVFLHDRALRITEMVSLDSNGAQAPGNSTNPALDDSGQLIAFTCSEAMVPDDLSPGVDIYLRDRTAGTTSLISKRYTVQSVGVGAFRPAMSGDGRFVVFQCTDDDVVPGDTNGKYDIFLNDRQSSTTELVSIWGPSIQSNEDAERPAVSDDGQFVAFLCRATNWAPVGPQPFGGVYRRDRRHGLTDLVNIRPDGSPSAVTAFGADVHISGNGRYVLYESSALDVTGQGVAGLPGVLLRDMEQALSTLVNVSPHGGRPNHQSLLAVLSSGGDRVAFNSDASNLVLFDGNPLYQDVFLRDMQASATVLVSVGDHGQAPNNGGMGATAISGDGRVVAFITNANNLIPGDSGTVFDVYVVDCDNTPVMRYCESMPNSLGCFPSLQTEGEPSLGDVQPFWIRAASVLSGSHGFFLYGVNGATGEPVIGGGWLCVQPPLRRLRWQRSGGQSSYHQCTGSLEVDFDAYARSGKDPALTVGTTVCIQAWSLDPQITQGTSLTDAVTFDLAP